MQSDELCSWGSCAPAHRRCYAVQGLYGCCGPSLILRSLDLGLLLGRWGAHEEYLQGQWSQHTEILRDTRPLYSARPALCDARICACPVPLLLTGGSCCSRTCPTSPDLTRFVSS